jgi:hypothetical protein
VATCVALDAPGLSGIFSDNNFTLLPGESKTVIFRSKVSCTCEELQSRLTVRSLRDSYK